MKTKKNLYILLSVLSLTIATQAKKPNVVFFLIDDLSHFCMPAYGAEKVSSGEGLFKDVPLKSPHIDSLAESGLRCDQAYAYPICEPTRVALMSGMHNGRNFIDPKALHHSQITFSDVLKRAGYTTGMYGKWKQTRGTKSIPGEKYISQFGWDDYCCFDVTDEGRRYLDPLLVENGEIRNLSGVNPETGRRWYGPDECNKAALRFIDNNKDKPFFLYYPLILVHDEHTPTPDTKPKSVYDEYEPNVKPEPWLLAGDQREYFPDMLEYMDKIVGKVLTKLDEHGLREETLVVIMGDNGTKECFTFTATDGSERQGKKGHNRDAGEHVGLLFSWPGTIPAGTEDKMRSYDGLVDIVDIYPTLLDACGVDVPNQEKIDGISAWPQIIGKKSKPDREFIYHWFNGNRPYTDTKENVSYAFTADFKRFRPHDIYDNGRFFDLRTDIEEEAGEKGREVFWHNWYFSGLETDKLTDEQKAAYDMLGKALELKKHVPVKSLQILNADAPISINSSRTLQCKVEPANATRNNVIWESSDPSIASINKFGELITHKAGKVTISVYSWDDAFPISTPWKTEYKKDGISDSATLSIHM